MRHAFIRDFRSMSARREFTSLYAACGRTIFAFVHNSRHAEVAFRKCSHDDGFSPVPFSMSVVAVALTACSDKKPAAARCGRSRRHRESHQENRAGSDRRARFAVEPIDTVAVKSLVDGQLLEARVKDGDEVKKGGLLFKIDPRPCAGHARTNRSGAGERRCGARTGESAARSLRTGRVERISFPPIRCSSIAPRMPRRPRA